MDPRKRRKVTGMISFANKSLRDHIYACWLGKNIGGTMGTPYEGRREMLDIQGFSTAPGVVLPNDDLDLQLIWLAGIEKYFTPYELTPRIMGDLWHDYIIGHWNEYGACSDQGLDRRFTGQPGGEDRQGTCFPRAARSWNGAYLSRKR